MVWRVTGHPPNHTLCLIDECDTDLDASIWQILMHSIALVLAHHQLVRECERPKVDPVKSFLHHMIRFEDRIGKGAQDGTFSRAMLFSKTEIIERE